MTKAERRVLMPQTAEVVDAFIVEFGVLAEIHAEENGHKVDWVRPETKEAA